MSAKYRAFTGQVSPLTIRGRNLPRTRKVLGAFFASDGWLPSAGYSVVPFPRPRWASKSIGNGKTTVEERSPATS